ncbi:unnamed protein product [Peniophora sp. CBMAI 1063]|nr:unnamed protein product [Peniophora sp. CBMAI 1063]
MAAGPEEDIDFETLQAQLDKTWAYAHSVVDSWTKRGKSTAAPSIMSDKELNDLLRRPSRLGVGAPMPDSTSSSVASAREALKLKYKLEGKDKKKRAREEEETHKGDEDEDGEESRASAIRKKPRIDPFASPGGKKRKAEKGSGVSHAKEQPVAGPSTLNAKATIQSPRPDKKGKRRARSSSQDGSAARYSPAVSATPSNAASSLKATSPETIPTPLPTSNLNSNTDGDNTGLPILNLDGPPPQPPASPSKAESSAAEKRRQKRRRQRERKKAKKAQVKQGESGTVSDTEEATDVE